MRANPPEEGVFGTLFLNEIRMLLRDTRTILIAVVAPLVMFPAYILIMNYVENREQQALEETTYTFALMGSQRDWAGDLVLAGMALDANDPDTTRAPANFELQRMESPEESLLVGDLHLVVQGFSPLEWDSVRAAEEPDSTEGSESGDVEEAGNPEEAEPDIPVIRILYRARSDFSREAQDLLTDRIREVRTARRDSVYLAAGFPVSLADVAPVESESVTTDAKKTGVFLGLALTPFLVLLMLSGGSIVAVDTISGDKERGTLETLLTTSASRTEIVRAKLMAVIVVGLAVAVINVANLAVCLRLGFLNLPADFAVEVTVIELLILLLLLIPVAVLVAASLLLLSGISKSFKEYQVYLFPLIVALMVPSMAPILPGIDLRSVIAIVPMAGVAVAVKEILVGEVDYPSLMLAFASTGALAIWLTILTQRSLSNEKLITGSDLDEADLTGGPALFPRHVLRWFLVLWVVFFLVSLWFGEALGLRGQFIVNLVGFFFGGSLLMIHHYGLNPVEAFGLRLPRPSAWVAVLIGTPSALILGIGLAQLVNAYVFPVPQQLLEGFGQALMGPELPLWQLVLFLCIMPGIFEELAFRGVLVYGLRRRFKRTWVMALAVGLIFGIFHVSLFRIVPTAWLGFVLTWVVVLSGSIYPAIVWHALSNALAIVPNELGLFPEDFEPASWWTIPAAFGLALSLWILARGRSESGGGLRGK